MFGGWEENDNGNTWMSYTDLMTGLLVIFIIVALALSLLKTDEKILANRYADLIEDFSQLFNETPTVSVADSATIRFTLPNKAFDESKHKPTSDFQEVLDYFIPAYYGKLQDIYLSEKDSFLIREIRVEGHTDSVDNYIKNLVISSARALEIQKYVVRHPFFKDSLTDEFKDFVLSHSIPVGYAYTRPLNQEGESISSVESNDYSLERSRRVEFRVLIEYLK